MLVEIPVGIGMMDNCTLNIILHKIGVLAKDNDQVQC